MTEQEKFLMLVQGALLAVVTKRVGSEDTAAAWMLNSMADAMEAAAHMPSNTTAREAATEFCSWHISGYEKPRWL